MFSTCGCGTWHHWFYDIIKNLIIFDFFLFCDIIGSTKKGDFFMQYRIHFNQRKIKKLMNPFKMTQQNVLFYVDIDPELLAEKDSWYYVDGKVSFFKHREDVRVAGECISQAYAAALGEDVAKYSVVRLHETIGLLSENFQQKSKYRYFDFCQLHQLFSSFPRRYNCFTLKSLLQTLEYYIPENYQPLQQSLINRYVFDWFTHQLDGNPRNSNFRQDRITGKLEIDHVFDKEQSFGVSPNGFFDEERLEIWIPSIPYDSTEFRDNPFKFEGLDANLFALISDYPDMTVKAFEHIFSLPCSEILETFMGGETAFSLPKETLNYLVGIADRKEYEKEKILQLV